jgi:hypothetical protein
MISVQILFEMDSETIDLRLRQDLRPFRKNVPMGCTDPDRAFNWPVLFPDVRLPALQRARSEAIGPARYDAAWVKA